MDYVRKVAVLLSLVSITALLSGCGESESNAPAVKLTASTVTSQTDATSHTHTVTIPFVDISASPADATYQYRSDITNNHSHVIALSRQQMIDIYNGMQVTLTSSSPDAGTDHTHTWFIRGGDMLYDKFCYNCHSNGKRGHNPMNVSFNASQTSAEKNPGGAPFSTSPAATPDPNYMPSTAISLDGTYLYAALCESCHGVLVMSEKQNSSFSQIKTAIANNSGGMGSLGTLTDPQLEAIAAALIH